MYAMEQLRIIYVRAMQPSQDRRRWPVMCISAPRRVSAMGHQSRRWPVMCISAPRRVSAMGHQSRRWPVRCISAPRRVSAMGHQSRISLQTYQLTSMPALYGPVCT